MQLQSLPSSAFDESFSIRQTGGRRMFRYRLSALLVSSVFVLTSLPLAQTTSAATAASSADRISIPDTKMALRDLWVEHIFWIRSFVLAAHAGQQAEQKSAEAEVLKNAKALSESIAPFYGSAGSDGLLKLLAAHWAGVRDYDTATLAKSRSGQDKAVAHLTSNAHEIAKFLNGANPNLPEDAVFGLLAGHAGHHVMQINQVALGDFQDEAATWHAMRVQVLQISDSIADAIVKQFPERFKERT
jgi:hypothetical protein